MTPQDEALLERALSRSNRSIGCVGVGTILLGAGMIALHALELDPEAADMSTTMVVLLYGFALFFIGLGALMLFVMLVRGPAQQRRLREVVRSAPGRITHAWPRVIKSDGAENLPGGQYCVCVTLDDGTHYQLLVSAADQGPLLNLLWQRAPGAARTPSAPGR